MRRVVLDRSNNPSSNIFHVFSLRGYVLNFHVIMFVIYVQRSFLL